MNKIIAFASLLLIAAGLAGTGAAAEKAKRYEKFADLDGKRIGVLTGTLFETLVNNTLERTQMFNFETVNDSLRALRSGQIDCIVDDEPALRFIAENDSRYRLLDDNLAEYEYGFLFNENHPELVEKFNAELSELKKSGELEKLIGKWKDGDGRPTADYERYSGNPLVRLTVFTETAPFAYRDLQGNIIGLDVELIEIICRRLGCRLDVTAAGFDAMFDSLLEGKSEVIAASLSITEDRKQLGIFTIPYYRAGVTALVLAD